MKKKKANIKKTDNIEKESFSKQECLHCKETLLLTQKSFCCLGCKTVYELIHNLNLSDYYKFCKEIYTSTPPKVQERDDCFNYDSYCEELTSQEIKNTYQSHNPQDQFFDIDQSCIHKKIFLMIEGIHCGSCIWLIEEALNKTDGILFARMNLSTKRLKVIWRNDILTIKEIAQLLQNLGYRPLPYVANIQEDYRNQEQRYLLKCLSIGGFVWIQNMMITMAIWSGDWNQDFGQYTRYFLNIFALMITIPGVIYSSMPFFRSALKAIKSKNSNMDVPISISIIVILLLSVQEMLRNTVMTYYEAASSLVLALLIGRYMEQKVRNNALAYARNLILSQPSFVSLNKNNSIYLVSVKDINPGDIILIAAGERVGADGIIIDGQSELDNSIITGESHSVIVKENDEVFAGSINILNPIQIKVSKKINQTLLSEIINLIESAEQNKALYRTIANKAASLYTPIVCIASFFTCITWLFMNASFLDSIRNAMSVMIITCPCAMGLAVPMVQTVVANSLIQKGILLKTSQGLERLAEIDTIIFDKTGTLTHGKMQWSNPASVPNAIKPYLLSLARCSKHPICKALVDYFTDHENFISFETTNNFIELTEIKEERGIGIQGQDKQKHIEISLLKPKNIKLNQEQLKKKNLKQYKMNEGYTEVVFNYSQLKKEENYNQQSDIEYHSEITTKQKAVTAEAIIQKYILRFSDQIRNDALDLVAELRNIGYQKFIILSGDNESSVTKVANALKIEEYHWSMTPIEKHDFILNLQSCKNNHSQFSTSSIEHQEVTEDKKYKNIVSEKQKAKVLMIGDGLNDSAALQISHASVSFANALEISQNQADVILRGEIIQLGTLLKQAKKGKRLIKQNFMISALYNIISIPIAACGMITPVYAAIFMSVSSIIVIINSLRGKI